ncbi:hypothetical protein HZC09_06205 [Candidatus Micrarchaeota archaeon]|nr:hypothetical protein [Candidatus Micrarchaeota archaeon]
MEIKGTHFAALALIVLIFAFFIIQNIQPPAASVPEEKEGSKKQVYLTKPSVVTNYPSVSFEGAQISFQSEETAGERTEKIILKNPTSKEASGSLLLVVPKEVAEDSLELTIDGAAATVLEEDPVLLISYQLKPNEEKEIDIGIRRSQAKRPQAGIMVVPLPAGVTEEQALEISRRIRSEGKIFYATQEEAFEYSRKVTAKLGAVFEDKKLTSAELDELENIRREAGSKGQVVETGKPAKQANEPAQEESSGYAQESITLAETSVISGTASPLLPGDVLIVPIDAAAPITKEALKPDFRRGNGEIWKYVRDAHMEYDRSGRPYVLLVVDLRGKVTLVESKLPFDELTGTIFVAVHGNEVLDLEGNPQKEAEIPLAVTADNSIDYGDYGIQYLTENIPETIVEAGTAELKQTPDDEQVFKELELAAADEQPGDVGSSVETNEEDSNGNEETTSGIKIFNNYWLPNEIGVGSQTVTLAPRDGTTVKLKSKETEMLPPLDHVFSCDDYYAATQEFQDYVADVIEERLARQLVELPNGRTNYEEVFGFSNMDLKQALNVQIPDDGYLGEKTEQCIAEGARLDDKTLVMAGVSAELFGTGADAGLAFETRILDEGVHVA